MILDHEKRRYFTFLVRKGLERTKELGNAKSLDSTAHFIAEEVGREFNLIYRPKAKEKFEQWLADNPNPGPDKVRKIKIA